MKQNGRRRNTNERDCAPRPLGGASGQDHPVRLRRLGTNDQGQRPRFVVVEPVLENTHERSVEIRGALGDIGYPLDVIVMRTERFERTKRVIGGIAYPANKYGRVIYEAA